MKSNNYSKILNNFFLIIFACTTLGAQEGEVIEIDRSNYRAKVKGLNLVKKHMKATKEKKGGIVTKENFINISNLILMETKKEKKTKA